MEAITLDRGIEILFQKGELAPRHLKILALFGFGMDYPLTRLEFPWRCFYVTRSSKDTGLIGLIKIEE